MNLCWFRKDLRIFDHRPLWEACRLGPVAAVYCLDPREFSETKLFGFPKTGRARHHFLWHSLRDLADQLGQLNIPFYLLRGHPEEQVRDLAVRLQAREVFYHREVTADELAVEQALLVAKRGYWGGWLFEPDSLPFEIDQLPELFTNFRKAVERDCQPLPPWPRPAAQSGLSVPIDWPEEPDSLAVFQGGERAGWERMESYFFSSDRVRCYKETRNGLLAFDDSSKLSPWLALGCLSATTVYDRLKAYARERGANESTYWLYFELLWREYFRWIALKHGPKLFRRGGLLGLNIPWKQDDSLAQAWTSGQTGIPLVDASMRELAATGYTSNRARQNVASFLTKNLGLDWRLGAEWFESSLVDYDVCSNWGNWNYIAGVGNDARGFRYFNLAKQSLEYDPKGEFVRRWVPELAELKGASALKPDKVGGYPRPVVDLEKSVREQEQIYRRALARLG